jgi:hypothetical protein
MSKEQQKKHIIDMMEKDQELGLYDIFNDEKRQGVKDLIDTHKQRLEKYSERFDNDKSEIGNPDTWGKRIVEEPKQETLEEAAERLYPISKKGSMWMPSADDCNKANKQEGFIEGAKWQAERMYNEKDLFKILLDFVAFPHEHMEPRGSIIERYLKELKNN